MRRWVFHIISLFSLLLAVAAGVMWVRSYSRVEMIQHKKYELREIPSPHTHVTNAGIVSGLGGVQIHHTTNTISAGFFEKGRKDPKRHQLGVRWLIFTEAGLFDSSGMGSRLYYPGGPSRFGFDFTNRSWGGSASRPPNTQIAATVPYWFLVLFCTLPPLAWVSWQSPSRRRLREGLCLHCGYDLRASPERCPECGRPNRQPIVNPIADDDRPSSRSSTGGRCRVERSGL
jgi:hypothetical protein